jgi:hypothetical protein
MSEVLHSLLLSVTPVPPGVGECRHSLPELLERILSSSKGKIRALKISFLSKSIQYRILRNRAQFVDFSENSFQVHSHLQIGFLENSL